MSVSAACLTVEEAAVHLESDTDATVALMTVRGVWNRPLCDSTTEALSRCLAEHPEALIVDLTALTDPRGMSAPIWIGAQRAASYAEPPVPLALCIPPDLPLADRMQRLGVRPHLPVFARVRQARVAVSSRLALTDRLRLELRGEPEAPSMARNLVTDACLTWELADVLHPARLVMSELVTNAVEHAGGDLTVVVARRGRGLHMIVADGSPERPRIIRPARVRRGLPLDERGRGLRTVDATATAWGWLPTRTGKVVWATVQGPAAEIDSPPRPIRRPRNDGPVMPRPENRTGHRRSGENG